MRTIAAGRLAACALLVAVVLVSGSIALGYRLAMHDAGNAANVVAGSAGASQDLTRTEGLAVVDHIGDLSGRLTRLEIEAAALARRLGLAPAQATVKSQDTERAGDRSSRGGPLLPLRDDEAIASAAGRQPAGGYSVGHLAAEIEQLETSLDRMAGVLAERELSTMAYPNRSPVQGRMPSVSSGFGVRHDPFTGRLARHMGLDIPAAHGTAILASGGGRVLSAGFRGPYGNAVVIDHGDGLQTLYGHCSKIYVRPGDLVMPRQKIAAVGSTGRSTGPHLHFELIRDGKRVAPGQVLTNVLARNPT